MNDDDPPTPDVKFNLKESETKKFTAASIYGANDHGPSSLLPLTYVSFLKALRRLLMTNLSSRRELIPFGNSGLLPDNKILQIDPKLVKSGQLFLSCSSKSHQLMKLNELPKNDSSLCKKYAIYLAPSGIRAYLASETLGESITSAPVNESIIIETLMALHSIRIESQNVSWVKMIPNLGHLNALTSQISDYLRPVQNSKYLVWPLELCFAQKAETISVDSQDRLTESFDDPFSLIDDFSNLKATSSLKTPSNIPTSTNTPLSLESPAPEPNTIFKPQTIEVRQDTTITPGNANETAGTNTSWSDLNEELFGEGDGVTDADFNFFDDEGGAVTDLDETNLEAELDQALEESNNDDLNLENTDSGPDIPLEDKLSNDSDPKDNHFDIPIEEITVPTTPLYTDPGAPEPVQSPRNARKRSIFSPLNFNPIIKSNVDDKYANGGKFFVSNVETPSTEVNAVPSLSGDKFMRLTDADDDDDDEEDDDDDDDDDEEEEDDEEEDDDYDDENDRDHTGNGNERDSKDNDSMVEDTPSTNKIPFVKDSTVNALENSEPEFKKLKLESPTPQATSIATQEQTRDSRMPSPAAASASNGTPNCIPFLLRSIPLHSIPAHFFSDTPVIPSTSSPKIIETFLHQIIWDDGCLSESIPKSEPYTSNYPDSVQRAIAQLFPEIHEANLAEISGISVSERMQKEYGHDGSIQAESPLSSFKNPEYVLSSQSHPVDSMDFSISSTIMPKDNYEEKAIEDSKHFFQIPQPKISVKRLNQEISVNASALSLWNLMSFTSLKEPKDLRLVLLSSENLAEKADLFLNDVQEIYQKFQLGQIERFQSNSIKNGVASVSYQENKLEDSALSVGRSFNSSLIKGFNYKDIVICLLDFEQNLKSVLKLTRVFESMKAAILALPNDRTLPIKISLKIIPSRYITNNGTFSLLSINKLTKLSLSLYKMVGDEKDTFASLTPPLPNKINFQLTKSPIASNLLCEDSFIHLAYGRSIDKEWCVASWTNQLGTITKTQAWHCPSKVKTSLESVTNELWDITIQLSKSFTGKKYVVLTRVDGTIPDDELLQWKRLSSKSRELSLIVVSVNENSKLLLTLDNPQYPFDKLFDQENTFANTVGSTKIDAPNTVGSSTGLTPSTIFTPQPVNSPDLFTMSRPNVNDSPSEFRINPDDSNTIVNISDKVHALIYTNPSPLANSPTRLSIKTGFLIKPVPNSHNKLATFEVDVLSCPGTLPLDELMTLLLVQYRSLAAIGEIYGIVDCQNSLMPWHIASVSKSLNCLVHIRVE